MGYKTAAKIENSHKVWKNKKPPKVLFFLNTLTGLVCDIVVLFCPFTFQYRN